MNLSAELEVINLIFFPNKAYFMSHSKWKLKEIHRSPQTFSLISSMWHSQDLIVHIKLHSKELNLKNHKCFIQYENMHSISKCNQCTTRTHLQSNHSSWARLHRPNTSHHPLLNRCQNGSLPGFLLPFSLFYSSCSSYPPGWSSLSKSNH